MEQRPLRLGDLVDDYCPRERRLTNHAVVAIVGNSICQTRCSTCEAEHPYKEGKVPRRKKKDATGELYDQVLAGVTGQLVTPAAPESVESAAAESEGMPPAPVEAETIVVAAAVVAAEIPLEQGAPPAEPEPPINGNGGADDTWPAHRRLIRAQLPRVEGQQPAPRPVHEFTMRQQHGRGNQAFRGGGGQGWSGGSGQGGGENRGNTRGGFRPGKFGGGGGGGRPAGGGRPNNSNAGRSRRSR